MPEARHITKDGKSILIKDMEDSHLVERLRTRNGSSSGFGLGPVCDEAAAEIERLTAALKNANDHAEHFERLWYLRGDAIEAITGAYDAYRHRGVNPAPAEYADVVAAIEDARAAYNAELTERGPEDRDMHEDYYRAPVERTVRPEFSEGICEDGAAILKNGIPLTITQILNCLKALDFLLEVKEHKDLHGKDDWYSDAKEIAWEQAKDCIGD